MHIFHYKNKLAQKKGIIFFAMCFSVRIFFSKLENKWDENENKVLTSTGSSVGK